MLGTIKINAAEVVLRTKMIAQIEPTTFWITVGALVGLWMVSLLLWVNGRRESEAIRKALRSTGDRAVDELLVEHFESKEQLEAQVSDLRQRMADAEAWMDRAIAYASIVRYDAFDNVAGNQSFAIAFQNSKGDGILLNAVSGRDQARIYGKSVEAGQTENGFTPEEKQAIIRALTRAKG
jgi:hypothetical protein